jgi:uncharacterized protein (TIGR03086 family)
MAQMDPRDLYERGSAWTATKVAGATSKLDAKTPCEKWKVKDVLSHLIDSNRYFREAAEGKEADLPADPPPADVIGKDPVADYERSRRATMEAYTPDVLEKQASSLGIAFVDQLTHGWDLATATGQDATMPDDLAEAAFQMVDGQLTPERRGTGFKPEVKVGKDASFQEKLLAYSGRQP